MFPYTIRIDAEFSTPDGDAPGPIERKIADAAMALVESLTDEGHEIVGAVGKFHNIGLVSLMPKRPNELDALQAATDELEQVLIANTSSIAQAKKDEIDAALAKVTAATLALEGVLPEQEDITLVDPDEPARSVPSEPEIDVTKAETATQDSVSL